MSRQLVAEACFKHGAPYIKEARKEYQKRRSMIHNGLKQIDSLDSYLPKAAFYNIIQFPFDDITPFSQWLLSEFSMNNETVMFAPADGFYFTPGLGKSQARIAYVLNTEKLSRSMDILKTAVADYQQLIS